MALRAVVWDIDDTIFDYTGTERLGVLRHLAAEGVLGRHASPAAAAERWHAVMETQYARFEAGELTFDEQRRERVRHFLGEELDDAAADAWFGRYRACCDAVARLHPDVLPALDALTPGYRHGLLSNSSAATQHAKLSALGVRDRFEALVCSAELGYAKPAPEAFHGACAALGLTPGEVAYVGDRPDRDAAAADAAGLFGVWLHRPGAPGLPAGVPPPARRITGLGQLPSLLARSAA
ncbi:HAD family hydrolase [Streptomyces sp. RFCAC02]|uniref:HAD family hydrolase n=1 Tax=Streptomyces sp. RFCAC02 TaxID=2499143 RepID=UPI00101F6480|nr:HAD family hydrolase [Streptomyces sp. RFCAC02]